MYLLADCQVFDHFVIQPLALIEGAGGCGLIRVSPALFVQHRLFVVVGRRPGLFNLAD